MVGICYLGPCNDASGYGEATRNFIAALYEVDANVCVTKVSFTGTRKYVTPASQICEELALKKLPYRIKILHVTPDNYKANVEVGKYNIGHLFWETDKLPKSWVAPCNSLQEIWTGTKYGAEVIAASGVKVPITVIPEAVDTSDIPDVRPYVLPNFNGIVFYSIFEWTERKNPKALLHTFWKTFKGKTDVCLLLKVHRSSQNDRGLRDILLEARGWKNQFVAKDLPRVFVYTEIMTVEEMHRLHKTGNVFVSAHRGEGWGLPQCEAAMHVKPIISVGYGGVHEYFRRQDYMPVDFSLVPISGTFDKYYEEGMQWAEANQEHLAVQMERAYNYLSSTNKRGLLGKYGNAARRKVQEYFSYEAVGKKMVERINQIAKEKGWDE